MRKDYVYNITVKDKFWDNLQKKIADVVIPHQWKALNDEIPDVEPSHAVENVLIAAKLKKGEFYGTKFQDSDIAKWIEAASYSIRRFPDPEIEKNIDWLVDILEKAQDKNGYLNTYYTVAKPKERWSNFAHGHELYCAGHLIEAAVAYYISTEKDKLLKVVCRYVDYIYNMFGSTGELHNKFCGHEEIELALYKLYNITEDDRYFDLMSYFINIRGTNKFLLEEPGFPTNPFFQLEYHQAHLPVHKQKEAVGHAVRAMYLYIAMADYILETKDAEMLSALKSIWEDIIHKKMYVTGGIGASAEGESFSIAYDLPPDRAYAETCASIGMLLWAQRMLKIDSNSEYADIAELELYNGILSGISEDGKKFFYVNPLQVDPKIDKTRKDHDHIKTQRVEWFGCACCPTNIARTIASVQDNIYTIKDDRLYINQYIGNHTDICIENHAFALNLTSEFPWKGYVAIEITDQTNLPISIAARIPGWSRSYSVKLNDIVQEFSVEDGYMVINRTWKSGDILKMEFDITQEFIYANENISDVAGLVCVRRGPIIYCAEEIDNNSLLGINEINIAEVSEEIIINDLNNVIGLKVKGRRRKSNTDKLYTNHQPEYEEASINLVPYYLWGNRGEGEMRVWMDYYGI